jgi:uncharacterized membrane protein YfcA
VDLPLDWRAALPVAVVAIAGLSKGITGLGSPAIAVPALALVYRLPAVVATMILPTVVSDLMMLARFVRHARFSPALLAFAGSGLAGIVVGTRVLVAANPDVLKVALACVVVVFVAFSWRGRMPVLGGRWELPLSVGLGLAAGVLQGSTGASGPLVTIYLFSLRLPREAFLFSINAVFLALDSTQLAALQRSGLITPARAELAALAVVPLALGVVAGIALQRRVDDLLFKRAVLAALTFVAVGLLSQALIRLL